MLIEELPIDKKVLEILKERGIEKLYPPQEEAVRRGLFEGRNILMVTQTASGKTMLAEILAADKAVKGRGKTVYLTPLKALASEKKKDFDKYSAIGVKTALSTGDYDSKDQFLADYDIIVTTYEKMDSLLRHKPNWLNEVSLVVIDEIHYIDDPERGPVLEALIAMLRELEGSIQILGLSATIGNPYEIAEWLDCEAIVSSWRPVPLKEGVYSSGIVKYVDGEVKYIERIHNHPVLDLARDSIKNGGQVLVFVNSRRKAVSLAEAAASKLGLKEDVESREYAELLRNASSVPSLNEKLCSLAKNKVCFHHAGLSPEQRSIIEEAFRRGVIKVLVATPTLAAGVNLPARRVVVDDYRRYSVGEGYKPIRVLEYKQFAGRAGRPGYDEYGEAIIVVRGGYADNVLKKYCMGEPESISSKMTSSRAVRRYTLAFIAFKEPVEISGILKIFSKTLHAHQIGVYSLKTHILKAISFLESEGFIKNSKTGYETTSLGRIVTEVYIDPLSASMFINKFSSSTLASEFSVLQLVAITPDMPKLPVRRAEAKFIESVVESRLEELTLPAPDEFSSYNSLLESVKTALMLEDWVNEVPEQDICSRYGIGPGDIRAYIETAEWILHAFHRISFFNEKLHKLSRTLGELVHRVRYGVKSELLELVSIPGIGRVRARKLYNAGFKTLRDIAESSIRELARIEGIGVNLAKEAIKYARLKLGFNS